MAPDSLKGSVLVCEDLDNALRDLEGHGLTSRKSRTQRIPWGHWKSSDEPDGNGYSSTVVAVRDTPARARGRQPAGFVIADPVMR